MANADGFIHAVTEYSSQASESGILYCSLCVGILVWSCVKEPNAVDDNAGSSFTFKIISDCTRVLILEFLAVTGLSPSSVRW